MSNSSFAHHRLRFSTGWRLSGGRRDEDGRTCIILADHKLQSAEIPDESFEKLTMNSDAGA